MNPYILIQPIRFGQFQEYEANAITWNISSLHRGSQSAVAFCTLIWEEGINTTYVPGSEFTVEIDNATLQSWGTDDTVIDVKVLAYSPLFVLRT